MRSSSLALALLLLVPPSAHAAGSSVENLVGVFSIEKTIRLGSSSECFRSSGGQLDPYSVLGDDQPPGLAGLSFRQISASPGQESPEDEPSGRLMVVEAHIIDDKSGVGAASACFGSPVKDEHIWVLFVPENLTSGTPMDGIYRASVLIPEASGEWVLENMTLVDRAGNSRTLGPADLIEAGLPSALRI